jgi:hypothetical protein
VRSDLKINKTALREHRITKDRPHTRSHDKGVLRVRGNCLQAFTNTKEYGIN